MTSLAHIIRSASLFDFLFCVFFLPTGYLCTGTSDQGLVGHGGVEGQTYNAYHILIRCLALIVSRTLQCESKIKYFPRVATEYLHQLSATPNLVPYLKVCVRRDSTREE